MVRTKKWHMRCSWVRHWCSYHIWHHLWSITCPWQGLPPAFLQTSSKICHCESEVLYPRTQHIDLACTQTCTSQPRVQYNDHKATASPTDIKMWWEPKSNTQGAVACVADVLHCSSFWHHLWYITLQTHSIMESIYFVWYRSKVLVMVTSSMCLSSSRWSVRTNQNACLIQPIM